MIILVALLCFIIRAYPRLVLKNVYSSDTYYHLYCAQVLSSRKWSIPDKLPRVLLPHSYTYPYFYHYILSLLSLPRRLWIERYTGAISDTVSLVVFYMFAVNLTEVTNAKSIISVPMMVSLLAALSPAQLRLGSGPRAYNGSPRTLGQTLYLIHILSIYLGFSNNSKGWLLSGIMAGAVAIITAKFTLQVLLLFSIVFSLMISPYYLLVIFASIILSIVMSWGHSLKIIKGHYRHSYLYCTYLQKIFLNPHLNTFDQYIESAKKVWKQKGLDAKMYWFLIVERYPVHLALTVFPQFLVLPLFIIHIDRLNNNEIFLLAWALAGGIFFIVTKWKPLLFLGEGERYLEYSLYPSIYLMLTAYESAQLYIFCLYLIYSGYAAIKYVKQYTKQYALQNEYYLQVDECFKQLDSMKKGVIWPIGSFHYQCLARSNVHDVLSHGGNMDSSELEDISLVYQNYPYPSNRIVDIVNKYSVKYIVSDNAHINYFKKNILNNGDEFDSMTELIAELPVLSIWKVKYEA